MHHTVVMVRKTACVDCNELLQTAVRTGMFPTGHHLLIFWALHYHCHRAKVPQS